MTCPLSRDRDQDPYSPINCAQEYTGGWWWSNCGYARPTGLHSKTKVPNGYLQDLIGYYHGGNRGNSWDSWAEVEFLLLPSV